MTAESAGFRALQAAVTDCVFCDIVAGRAPADVVWVWPDAFMIRPLDPVVDGHVLVLPVQHVRDAAEDPEVTAAVMRHAAAMCHRERPVNIITSIGSAATQSVFHLHVHIVPRAFDDGLALPWTPQHATSENRGPTALR